jgi:5-formyltetrahydrofolate cyclo-ligase
LRADAVKIGVAFEVQIVERVPVEGHDARMDWVVTEGREVRVRSGE